ncbi:MAG: Spermidine/putrescine-binding periplasmic protein [Pseudomonas citronellolis]|nr:MAG: Spermidine/putrescine-binding periplasmic protein [Pseudomonas citronellolis]
MAYNQDKVQGTPSSWADFWDVKKYPGKRGLRWGAKYSLEFALMADGVAPRDVYKVLANKEGQDRAFRKLDEIKPHIHWWKSGQDPVRDLADGTVVMSSAYNGRIAAAQQKSYRMVWAGGIYDFDFWALPSGVFKKELAERFISFASQPQQQKVFAENIAYGPTNRKALEQLDPGIAANLPTAPQNIANAVGMDVAFWAEHGDALEKRFEDWAKH